MILIALALLAWPGPAPSAPHRYRAPRTAFGQPDLQGYWTNVAQTPLERPAGLPLTFSTKAEGDAYEKQLLARERATDNEFGQAASEWAPVWPLARINGQVRTSWVVWPADGRIPYRPEARRRLQAIREAANSTVADGPEQRSTSDRCLMGGGATGGPPLLNHHSGSAIHIVQTSDAVAIRVEMNHDVRIVHLGGRHPPPAVRQWLGDSIGHWEGETLVVETTNFHPLDGDRGKFLRSPDARVTERFTRVSPTELDYAFQVDDPATVTGPWRGEIPFRPEKSPIWEYACHEGNYSMTGILAGARRGEVEAARSAGAADGAKP